jgi:hypothetical protein
LIPSLGDASIDQNAQWGTLKQDPQSLPRATLFPHSTRYGRHRFTPLNPALEASPRPIGAP